MQPADKRMAHANKADNQPIFKALLFHLTCLVNDYNTVKLIKEPCYYNSIATFISKVVRTE